MLSACVDVGSDCDTDAVPGRPDLGDNLVRLYGPLHMFGIALSFF